MLQWVAEEVYAEVRQDAVARPPPKKRVAALQYVIQNRSRRCITVRLDFSLSHQIQLVFPEEITLALDEKASSLSVIDIVVGPLRRRHAVHVVRAEGERAYVRVEYSVQEAAEIDTPVENENDLQLGHYITQSAAAYAGITVPNNAILSGFTIALTTAREIHRWCEDINRWSRQRRVWFVDPSFSPTPDSPWGKRSDPTTPTTAALPVTWTHLSSVVDASWRFVDRNKTEKQATTTWSSSILAHASWVCANDVLHDHAAEWCTAWFGDRTLVRLQKSVSHFTETSVVGVTLCLRGQEWVVVVVDLFVPVVGTGSRETQAGLACTWPHSGEIYAVLLQKAYAKLCGSYATVAAVSTRRILQDLTGRAIVQVFPSVAWSATGGVVANLKATLSPQRKTRKPRSLLMVSFGGFDDHHCALHLLPSLSTTSLGIRVQDPTRTFRQIMSTKLQLELDADEEDGACVVPDDIFIQLDPVVFEVLVDHSFTWRRRRVSFQPQDKPQEASLRVAVSCASLQHLVVQFHAKCVAGVCGHGAGTVTVDQIGDEDQWTRLDVNPHEEHNDTDGASTQVSWTAPAGEYVISFSTSLSLRGTGSDSLVLVEEQVHENLSLLFRILDQNMDGTISRTELVDFLCDQERLAPRDPTVFNAAVDAFVGKYAISPDKTTRGLTKDDLLQVYEAVAASERVLSTTQRLDDRLKTLIWNDLCRMLSTEVKGGCLNGVVPLDDLFEIGCVVSSDRDDIVLASLG